jgi:hypothetical protein
MGDNAGQGQRWFPSEWQTPHRPRLHLDCLVLTDLVERRWPASVKAKGAQTCTQTTCATDGSTGTARQPSTTTLPGQPIRDGAAVSAPGKVNTPSSRLSWPRETLFPGNGLFSYGAIADNLLLLSRPSRRILRVSVVMSFFANPRRNGGSCSPQAAPPAILELEKLAFVASASGRRA